MIGRSLPQLQTVSPFQSFVILMIEGMSFSVEVFLRRKFGCRYIDNQAWMAAFLIPVYAFFWRNHDPIALCFFWLLYMLFATFAWLGGRWRLWRGDLNHSRYSGWPRFLRPHLHAREVAIKKYFEPFAVICIALIIGDRSLPLSTFLVAAAICLIVSVQRSEDWMRRRVLDMNDAVAEQHHVTERFQALRGESQAL